MKTCPVCTFVKEHDYLPAGVGSHCSDGPGTGCHVTLSSPNYSHCGGDTGCHRSFASDRAFDAHLGPHGICRDPSSLKNGDGEARFIPVERHSTTVWKAVRFLAPDHGTKVGKGRKPRIAPHRRAS